MIEKQVRWFIFQTTKSKQTSTHGTVKKSKTTMKVIRIKLMREHGLVFPTSIQIRATLKWSGTTREHQASLTGFMDSLKPLRTLFQCIRVLILTQLLYHNLQTGQQSSVEKRSSLFVRKLLLVNVPTAGTLLLMKVAESVCSFISVVLRTR